MPAFGEVNTPGDQLIWRQLIAKEKDFAAKAPRSGFSLRCAVNREEVPVRFKPGHIDPSVKNTKGFDPKAYGWDPKGELATEFRKCRKRSTAPPTNRFLFPETTAQENGWCQKPTKERPDKIVKLPTVDADKSVKVDAEAAERRRRRREAQETTIDEDGGEPKRGLGKWASDSQLSAAAPIGSQVSAIPPSYVSSAVITDLSRTSSWPGVAKELVARVREQDVRVAKAMEEYNRYLCYGDRGNKHFRPLGETDATAYANAFMLATSGVPPHKWDPRAGATPKPVD
jgi:hypothetical protein